MKNQFWQGLFPSCVIFPIVMALSGAPSYADDTALEASMQALKPSDERAANCADCGGEDDEEEEISLVPPADSLFEARGKDRSGPEFNGREEDPETPAPGLLPELPVLPPVQQAVGVGAPPPAPLLPELPAIPALDAGKLLSGGG